MKVVPITTELIEILHERHPEIFHRPKRPWVGLTDDEVNTLWNEWKDAVCLDHKTWAKAIEAKLKELNT